VYIDDFSGSSSPSALLDRYSDAAMEKEAAMPVTQQRFQDQADFSRTLAEG